MKSLVRYSWAAFTSGMLMYSFGLFLFYFSGQSGYGVASSFQNAPFMSIGVLAAFSLSYGALGFVAYRAATKDVRMPLLLVSLSFLVGEVLAIAKLLPIPFLEDLMFAPIFLILSGLSIFYSYKNLKAKR